MIMTNALDFILIQMIEFILFFHIMLQLLLRLFGGSVVAGLLKNKPQLSLTSFLDSSSIYTQLLFCLPKELSPHDQPCTSRRFVIKMLGSVSPEPNIQYKVLVYQNGLRWLFFRELYTENVHSGVH